MQALGAETPMRPFSHCAAGYGGSVEAFVVVLHSAGLVRGLTLRALHQHTTCFGTVAISPRPVS